MRADDERAEHADRLGGQIRFPQQPGPDRIVDIVVDVGDEVGDARDLAFERRGALVGVGADRRATLALRVLGDAVAHFPREVEPAPLVLEHVHDAQALLVVIEAARHQVVQHPLAGMAEGRVAQVVAERDGFGELFVEMQHLRDGAGDLRDLERVRQPRAVVIAGRREEDLRLVLQPPERLAVDDAIAVALEGGTDVVFGLGPQPSARVGGTWRPAGARISRSRCFELRRESASCSDRRRKLVPCASGPMPKLSAIVCPRSANVSRVPRSSPARTRGPVTSSGTYSRE